jgi:carboxymethylenebutenolidase
VDIYLRDCSGPGSDGEFDVLCTQPLTQIEIDQRVFDLYEEYCHGHMDRREFLQNLRPSTAGGLAMVQSLLPRYRRAEMISFTARRFCLG